MVDHTKKIEKNEFCPFSDFLNGERPRDSKFFNVWVGGYNSGSETLHYIV